VQATEKGKLMIPMPEMAYAEFVGNHLLVAVPGGARVLAIAVSASSFFLGALLFHSVVRQSARQRRFQPAATKTIMWTSIECQCNLRFFQRSLGLRGLDVKILYQ